jgi:hypothetical protein
MNAHTSDPYAEYGNERDSNTNSGLVDFADVKAATLRSLDLIVPRLLPGGKRQGDEYVVRNPTRSDNKPGSFSINMKTGVWSDFATGDSGGDMVDLYMYVHGCTNIQAKNALADMLNVQAGTGSTPTPKPKPKPIVTAAPAESREAPLAFPPRTQPDEKGKPFFVIAGDDGPTPRKDEVRRHVYRRGGVAVRIKIIKVIKKANDSRATNMYRVTDISGVTGWQSTKPEGFQQIPYFVEGSDPFTAEIGRIIFWVEGEKDVETVAKLGGLAFTFGGAGDGLPDGCQQYVVGRNVVILADNDDKGRKHAEEKAALAKAVAASVKVIHFRELEAKQDVSDWIEAGHTFEDLKARVLAAPAWQPTAKPELEKSKEPSEPSEQQPSPPQARIKVDNFQAFLPEHKYIYIPTRDLWSAIAVNSQLPPIPVLDKNGKPQLGPSTENKAGEVILGEPEFMTANVWLDKNQSVEQMTWAPGLPMLIRGRLIQDGGWFDHAGASCFNLYRPPTIKHGDATKAGRWVDHVRRVYPVDWDHIIKWLAHHAQHPEIKVNHNLILGGNVGVGKDTLLAPAVQAVGPWNCSEVSPDNLFEPFNEYLKAVLMRVSEARDIGDVSKFQLYERMKTIGAAPPETLRVNEKNKPAHHIVNIVGAIITTNHKTNSLYLPADDRRHYAAWSDVKHSDLDSSPGAGDASKYFDALWNWYQQEDGFEHVAAYLATLDLSGFNPKAPPFKTPAFWAIVDANRPGEESEISDLLETIGNPPVITIEWMGSCAQGDLSDFFKDRKNRASMRHRLDTAGYEPVRNDMAKDGFWKVDGGRRVIYARKELSVPEQFKAARKLADGCVWQFTGEGWPGNGGAFQLSTWQWSKPASLAMEKLHSSEAGPSVA